MAVKAEDLVIDALQAANKRLRDQVAEFQAAMHEAGLTFEDDPEAGDD